MPRHFYQYIFFVGTGIPVLSVSTGKPVMVPRDGSFRVECSVPAGIDYCWLRHPNGTAVPVTVPADGVADCQDRNRYQYVGEGLPFGQCHVAIADATTSDTGTWLCALGLRNDRREMYGSVDVTVSGNCITSVSSTEKQLHRKNILFRFP